MLLSDGDGARFFVLTHDRRDGEVPLLAPPTGYQRDHEH